MLNLGSQCILRKSLMSLLRQCFLLLIDFTTYRCGLVYTYRLRTLIVINDKVLWLLLIKRGLTFNRIVTHQIWSLEYWYRLLLLCFSITLSIVESITKVNLRIWCFKYTVTPFKSSMSPLVIGVINFDLSLPLSKYRLHLPLTWREHIGLKVCLINWDNEDIVMKELSKQSTNPQSLVVV